MTRCIALLGLALVIPFAQAAEPWRFTTRIAVGAGPQQQVFHHLDGAGRKHLALTSEAVAAVWEDNHSGAPQIYVARKHRDAARFENALRVSGGSEAYEPAIVALRQNRFLLAWEQDGAIRARIFDANGLGADIELGRAAASHVSLAHFGERGFAAWREQREHRWYLRVASLRIAAGDRIEVEYSRVVETDGVPSRVLFPSLAVNTAGLCIAWEDRRTGHTRLLVSHSSDGGKSFAAPQNLNEFFSGRNQYDQGSGVTRVSLASFAEDEILAAWMDKRRGGLGYGIFAALGSDGGAIFGPNEKVHADEGDELPHYNPATAGNAAGDFVVAWDDYRRGDSDIWLSSYDDEDEWSRDFTPAFASGAGEQSHPSVALDTDGSLHLLWMERADLDAPSRLWYSHARKAENP